MSLVANLGGDIKPLALQASVDGTQNGVVNSDAFFSLRGGGASDDASVFTLFVRVFVPTFRRHGAGKEGLDLDGGGLFRRLRHLYSGAIRSVMGKGRKAGVKDPEGDCSMKFTNSVELHALWSISYGNHTIALQIVTYGPLMGYVLIPSKVDPLAICSRFELLCAVYWV